MGAHHHGDGHDPNLAHHFESADQQYQSAKLGMWVFLMTEILFFGGLFVAYTVYRVNHPEVFVYGAHFLDRGLGALNTVVLILSSFTIAWAVRAAQLKQISLLRWLILATMACAFAFMGVKAVEYNSKWKHGLLWAAKYSHHVEEADHDRPTAATDPAVSPDADPNRSAIPPAAEGPAGLAKPAGETDDTVAEVEPENAKVFFSIYFLMTGLHGIHVLAGIGAMIWLLKCLARGDFDGGHFTKVDMVALYWHVVDLVWIYLFLLLYLID